jgi:hypothetical protein
MGLMALMLMAAPVPLRSNISMDTAIRSSYFGLAALSIEDNSRQGLAFAA